MSKMTPDEQKRLLEKHVASSTDQKPLPTEDNDQKPKSKISFEDQMKLMDARKVEQGVSDGSGGMQGQGIVESMERLIALIEDLPDTLANRFGVD